ncbi:unnamed protein product [Didymodactylos carnosus]|uniref:Cytochrome c oxidase subunit Vb n=1 Tax=Didymodactylos carnosus TaxID=1234261 RepID=A0A8S2HDX4_9BILA|nr:unnamed protein product [Didymodactylos carnosus]CAF3634024.1 unnamed protein product [Didymodactylos carnosus]
MLAQLAANKIPAPRVLSICCTRSAGSSSKDSSHSSSSSHSPPTSAKHEGGAVSYPSTKNRVLPADDGKVRFPNVWDLALNKRRFEYAMKFKGYDDPWGMMPVKRLANSSPENANLVPSAFDKRLIGCVCNEDVYHIKWMYVHKGEPKRCYCGHWFKVVERTWPDLTDFGITPEMLQPQHH